MTPLALADLNDVCGLQGELHTRAPRAWAICMMLFSTVVAPGAIRVSNKESPMPVFVEKNMSACAVVKLLRQAEEAPNPSMRWKVLVQFTAHCAVVEPRFSDSTKRSSRK